MDIRLKKMLIERFKEEHSERADFGKEAKGIIDRYKKEYREKILNASLTIDEYTNIIDRPKVVTYLCNFLEKETVLFGNSRPGYNTNYMICLNKDKKSYYINKAFRKDKKEKKDATKEEAEESFEEIKELLKKIIDAKTIDEYANILDNNETYKKYSAKQPLEKLIFLESVSDEKKEIYYRLPEFYEDNAVNVLYETFVEKNENEEETNKLKKKIAILDSCYEIIKEEEEFKNLNRNLVNNHIIHEIIWNVYKAATVVSEEQPNAILYGAPGTGKTYETKKAIKMLTQGDSNRYMFIQCHPNFDYDDFIEGIKPVGQTENGQLKFEVVNGVFKDFCIKAKKDQENEYYFIADEINRANLSSLFGECLSLIEKDYRDNPPSKEEQENKSQRKEKLLRTPLSTVVEKLIAEKRGNDLENYIENNVYEIIDGKVYFGIPKNIRFIGMMNDVDKSIDAFDLALRRRFKWIRKDCDFDVVEKVLTNNDINYNDIGYIERCKALNNFITDKNGLNFGKSYEFGHSYFLKIQSFISKKRIITPNNMANLFEEHLKPVLTEYIRSFKEESEIEDCLKKAKEIFIPKKEKDNNKESEIAGNDGVVDDEQDNTDTD